MVVHEENSVIERLQRNKCFFVNHFGIYTFGFKYRYTNHLTSAHVITPIFVLKIVRLQ
jgi:hypothetical protein